MPASFGDVLYCGLPDVSGKANTDLSNLTTSAIGKTLPVGTVLPYAGSTVPDGFLLCDGSAISRTTYINLFNAIGTAYGSGDGNTTFNLPNANDKTLWQKSDSSRGSISQSLPNITGWFRMGISGVSLIGTQGANGVFSENSQTSDAIHSGTTQYTGRKYQMDFSANSSNSIYQDNANVIPNGCLVNMIIKF